MESRPLYFHYRRYAGSNPFATTLAARGGLTLSAVIVDESDMSMTLDVGVAFCSTKDNFCRRKGRQVADARRQSAPLRLTVGINRDDEGRVDFSELRGSLILGIECAAPAGDLRVPGKFDLVEVW